MKMISDVVKNFLATVLVFGFLQLLIFPKISQIIGKERFGELLFFLGVIYILNSSVASALSNLRLRRHFDKKSNDFEKSFLRILLLGTIISFFIYTTVVYLNTSEFHYYYLNVYLFLLFLRTYLSVYFRLKLEYTKFLIVSFVIASVYAFFYVFNNFYELKLLWLYVFIISEFAAVFYILLNLSKELTFSVKNEGIKFLLLDFFLLAGLNVLESTYIYLERILLKPLLGAEQLSSFFVLTIISKLQPFIISTFSGVLLSYLALTDFKVLMSKFKSLNLLSISIIITSLIIIQFINPFILKQFYPQYLAIPDIDGIFLASNIAYALVAFDMFLKPILIRFIKIKFIMVKELSFLALNFIVGFYLIKNFGLKGYPYSLLFVGLCRIVISYVLIFNHNRNFRVKEQLT